MKLYTNPLSSNCRKIIAVAEHLGLTLELQEIDFRKGEHKSPEFLAMNPNGKIPVLVDGARTLWESNAIMAYVCSKVDNTDLWPKSDARYSIMQWLFWEAQHLTPVTGGVVFEAVVKRLLDLGEPDAKKIEEGQAKFRDLARVLDGHLAKNRFLVGDKATLADFSNAAILAYAMPPALPINEFPQVQRWLADLHEIPAWKNTAPKMPG